MLSRFAWMSSVVMSIGAADAIECCVSPRVHREHNCPHIMSMRWCDYSAHHAFLSGVKCSWFLILPLALLPQTPEIVALLDVLNLAVPMCCWWLGLDKKDPYFGHTVLYALNAVMLSASIANQILVPLLWPAK